MASEVEIVHSSNLLSDDVKKIVEDIAKGAAFEDFEIIVKNQAFAGDNFMGEITRVKISPLKSDGQKCLDLILKKISPVKDTRVIVPLAKFFEREIFMYTDILPALDSIQESSGLPVDERFSFAKFYKGSTEEFKEMIVLEDISGDGYVMRDKRTPFDLEHAEIVIKKLASFHANSFVLKEKDAELFTKLSGNVAQSMNLGERMVDMVQMTIDKVLLGVENSSHRDKVKAFSQRMKEDLFNLLDARLSEPYNVICHGDSWNNNMLFKYKDGKVDEVILIDWQIVRLASPATDLTFMICMSMDRAFMETHLEHLMDLYYETLSLALTKMGCDAEKCYPEEIFKEQLKRQMPFGLFMTFCILPPALSETKDAKSIDDALKDLDSGVSGLTISDCVADRLKGLIDYFVKNELI